MLIENRFYKRNQYLKREAINTVLLLLLFVFKLIHHTLIIFVTN